MLGAPDNKWSTPVDKLSAAITIWSTTIIVLSAPDDKWGIPVIK